MHTSSSNIII